MTAGTSPTSTGRSTPLKTRPIPPCRSSAMSSIESAPATMPATKAETFTPAFAPLSVGTLRWASGQFVQTRRPGQPQNRHQPGRRHQIRLVEHRRHRGGRVRELHPRDALPARRTRSLRQVQFSKPARASSLYGTLNPRSLSVDPGLTGRSCSADPPTCRPAQLPIHLPNLKGCGGPTAASSTRWPARTATAPRGSWPPNSGFSGQLAASTVSASTTRRSRLR